MPTDEPTDPMERLIKDGLNAGCFRYTTDFGGGTDHGLDFHLVDLNIAIEVKQFHTDRIADQMSRHPNVIAVQGREAVQFMAELLARARGRIIPPVGIHHD